MRPKLPILVFSLLLVSIFISLWVAGGVLSAPAPATIGPFASDLVGRSVEFQSSSGSTLHGWFLPGQKGRGAVLLMHGVRANRLSMVGEPDSCHVPATRCYSSISRRTVKSADSTSHEVSGAKHEEIYAFAKEEYERRILSFFEKTLNH